MKGMLESWLFSVVLVDDGLVSRAMTGCPIYLPRFDSLDIYQVDFQMTAKYRSYNSSIYVSLRQIKIIHLEYFWYSRSLKK